MGFVSGWPAPALEAAMSSAPPTPSASAPNTTNPTSTTSTPPFSISSAWTTSASPSATAAATNASPTSPAMSSNGHCPEKIFTHASFIAGFNFRDVPETFSIGKRMPLTQPEQRFYKIDGLVNEFRGAQFLDAKTLQRFEIEMQLYFAKPLKTVW